MTTINLSIEAHTRRGTLLSIASAYVYAALLVAGPWIFTVVGLSSLSAEACDGECAELTIFRSILIYNSMFALIVTSPMTFFIGRYVSQQFQEKQVDSVPYVLALALGLFGVTILVSAVPFYFFTTTLEDPEKVASIHNLIIVGYAWILIPFLGPMRAHNALLLAFACGAAVTLLYGAWLSDASALSLLDAFNVGFAITDAILLLTILRRFGYTIVIDRQLTVKLRHNWQFAAVGATYALGLWIDKIVMWCFAPAGHLVVAGALQTMPSYDTAMFWAQLASIPAVAIFFVHVETQFSAQIRLYYARMQKHASARELGEIIERIRTHVLSSLFGLFVALAAIAALMIMISFVFMSELGLKPAYMSVLRISLCAMVFYTSAMFCSGLLLQLDLRRQALVVVGTFLALNTCLTTAFLPLGPNMYGYGNMIAAAVSLIIGVTLLLRELSWFNYHVFITGNASR